MKYQSLLADIRSLITRDDLAAALNILRSLLENAPQLDEVLHQSGRFENIRKQIRTGIVGHKQTNVEQNHIRAALLELLTEIEAQGQQQALRAEIERAISIVNSKNVVTGNVSAERDAHVGDKHDHIHHHYGGQHAPPSRSKWLKISAAIVTVIGLFAGVAEISGYSLRDYWQSEEPASIIPEPEKPSPLPVPSPSEAVHEAPKTKPYQPPTAAPRNHFESRDSSRQINIPDNQGTININQ